MKELSVTFRRSCLNHYGCTPEEALALNDGLPYATSKSPMERFKQQKWMAVERGFDWQLTFPEWKGVWDRSGKWEQRGRFKVGRYFMGRHDKKRAFCIANVFIDRVTGKTKPPLTKAEKNAKFAKRFCVDQDDFESCEQMRFARQRYVEQRSRARARNIEWLITFADWWVVWKASGLWESRGRECAASAVMSRRGDVGPYSKENVAIVTLSANFVEYWEGRPNRGARGRRIKAQTGKSAIL